MPNVIITGASTGIGRAIAIDLHRRGWSVLAGVRRDSDGDTLVEAAGPGLTPLQLDVTSADDLSAAFPLAQEFCGDDGLHALINNAGIVVPGPLEFLPLDGFRTQLEVNTTGALAATQTFLPLMREAVGKAPSNQGQANASAPHQPRILMVSSISGRVGTPLVGAYNASKFAMEGMSDAMRRELLPHGIDVVLIEPGAIATPIWQRSSDRADRMQEKFPPQFHQIYGPFLDGMRRNLPKVQKRAIPAQRVADVVATALQKRKPKARYLVGTDAKIGAWLNRLLPTRLFDRLITWDATKS
jgi:NAD(P)-dependent dehydrogenase (short-subunit alcohol dehydrogenase family)